MSDNENIKNDLSKLLLSVDRIGFRNALKNLEKEHDLEEVINLFIFPILEQIGKLWEEGKVALSQVYMSGRLCEDYIAESFKGKQEKVDFPKIGLAVLEDHHPLGIFIIDSLLKSYGIKPIKYEIGIRVEELIQKILEDRIEILIISTLMLRSALKIKDLTAELNKQGTTLKIIVGGAPFNFDDQLWKKVNADTYGKNAFETMKLIKQVMEDE